MSYFLTLRKFLALVVVFTIFFPSLILAESLTIRPGFQHILDRTDIHRISIGNPEIIEARPLPGNAGILIVGKKEGSTDLILWGKRSNTKWIVEVQESGDAILDEALRIASNFPGLSIVPAGRYVILRGKVRNASEKKLIDRFISGRKGIFAQVTIPEEEKSLLSYDLKIIEIGKGSTNQFGIHWPESLGIQGTISAERSSEATLTVTSKFDAALNLLLAHGKARILANPKLACESGQNATFLAGGEIPIVIVTPETRTVEWKTYGIILKISSVMEPENRVRTDILAEISTIDHGSGSSDIPGLLTRRVSTRFTTLPGETIMLSGLVKNEMAKDVVKVPLIGQIPILGELFKSRKFRENQTELAIFITPSKSEGAAHRLAEWEQREREAYKAMRYKLID